jgi:hypothetical protein
MDSVSQPLATGISATGPQGSWEPPDFVDTVGVEVNVTTAGTTGTYQVEGSMDGANWYAVDTFDSQDLSSAPSALTRTYTTTGRRMLFVVQSTGKWYRLFRINATTLTGQTYNATAFGLARVV